MKIAVIAMSWNDDHRLAQWRKLFDEYKNDIAYHIIADNASKPEFVQKMKETFPDSIILCREENGGCTAAYNTAIKYALENTDADAITIVDKTVKLSEDWLRTIYNYLYSNKDLGMVTSMELDENGQKILSFGGSLKKVYMSYPYYGQLKQNLQGTKYLVDTVHGGCNMAKRVFYEKAGLQDEKLFMYCDEVDTGYKAKKHGFIIGVTSDAFFQRIKVDNNKTTGVEYYRYYLLNRNLIYLAKKYLPYKDRFIVFFKNGIYGSVCMFLFGLFHVDKRRIKTSGVMFIGSWNGLTGNMKRNKYYSMK